MNQPAKVWALLKHSPDPRVRSYLIHRLSPLGADVGALIQRLAEEPDTTIRRALLLSLGEFSERELPAAARQALLPKLQAIYRTDADAGLHASAEWLLRQWNQEAWLKQVNQEWAKDKEQRAKRLEGIKQRIQKASRAASAPGVPPQWYVNGQGQTMVVVPGPVEFVMGSPVTEEGRQADELQHTKKIGRTFAIAAHSVTVEQYRRFQKRYTVPGGERTRLPDLPAVGFAWYPAARYCYWLSNEERIPEQQWCYEIKGKEIKLKANYLSLSGYRLPTEAEMEYATRAGSKTARYFGETEHLLPRYARYTKNSDDKTWPVGGLKPNEFGLFDVQGNVFTWCQESYKKYYPRDEDDKEDSVLAVDATRDRMLRGGHLYSLPLRVRSANRDYSPPSVATDALGFRLATTLPLGSFAALSPTLEGGRK